MITCRRFRLIENYLIYTSMLVWSNLWDLHSCLIFVLNSTTVFEFTKTYKMFKMEMAE